MKHNIVDIGQVITNGILFDPKNSDRVANMNTDEIFKSISRLFQLLDDRKVEYVLVGGIAMLVYVEGRNTQDVDLIIARDSLDNLPELTVTEVKEEFGRAKLGELQIDLLFADNKLFKLVRDQYTQRQQFIGRNIPCATVEGILLLKLFALPTLYRQGNLSKARIYENDIASLIEHSNPPLPQLIDTLRPHLLASDVTELAGVVDEIQERIKKARTRFGNSD